jgi:pyruvate dehydrogenase (quinone)
MLSLRYPMEVNLVGDSAATLRALIPHLVRKTDRRWRERIERDVARWWKVLESRAFNEAKPLNPQRPFSELSSRLPENCIVTADSGSCAAWYARDVRLQRGMMGSLSGGLATMGSAIPYAIAAKEAHPQRAVIALVGDGAMQMNGINGLITISRRWRDWEDRRLVVMVLNNRDLNFVTWEQRVNEGEPRYENSQGLPDFPYASYAEMLGLRGVRVDRPDAVGPAWDMAFAANRPTVIDMVVDPNVPPLPPHVSGKQARAYFAALRKGDRDAASVLKATAREWWDGLFPSRSQ